MPIIDNCDSIANWFVGPDEYIADLPLSLSTDCVEGVGSVRMDIASIVGWWAYLATGWETPQNWSLYPLLDFSVKVSALRGTTPLVLTIWHGNWVETAYNLPGVIADMWQQFRIDLRQPGDIGPAPDLTQIRMIRFDFWHPPNDPADWMQVDMLQTSTPIPRNIGGKVRDQTTGTAIMNVAVTTTPGNLTDYTMVDGSFGFSGIPAGIYTLTCVRSGYVTKDVVVDCTEGDVLSLDILMEIGEEPPPPPNGGCFVATAAYGSPLAPQLGTLRWFRDHCLPKSITQTYYKLSPPFADFIRCRSKLRRATRIYLNPLIMLVEKLRK